MLGTGNRKRARVRPPTLEQGSLANKKLLHRGSFLGAHHGYGNNIGGETFSRSWGAEKREEHEGRHGSPKVHGVFWEHLSSIAGAQGPWGGVQEGDILALSIIRGHNRGAEPLQSYTPPRVTSGK